MHLRLRTQLTIVTYALAILLSPFVIFAHESSEANSAIIHIGDSGYEPRSITIERGTTVIFENETTADRWPASDDHPSHTNYTGTTLEEHCASETTHHSFDACLGIKSKETWSFTFGKVGTHHYHDHLWPHLTGEIIVVEPEQKPNSIQKFFIATYRQFVSFITTFFHTNEAVYLKPERSTQYEETVLHYVSIANDHDPGRAITQLETDAQRDAFVSSLCHDILHSIGKSAYKTYGSFENAAIYQTDFCNSGYIHGLFEAYFQSETVTAERISQQCTSYAKNKSPFHSWQCYHGVGHGLMYHNGGDIDESIALCQSYFEGVPKNSCINGAYMEAFNQEILSKEQTLVDSNDPFSVCRDRSTAKAECYLYAPTYFLHTLSLGYHDTLKQCDNAEPKYRDACIAGVGSEAMKRTMNDPYAVLYFCELENEPLCAYGAISMYMFQTGSYEAGDTLCQSAPSAFFGAVCDTIMTEQRAFFTPPETIGRN